MGFINMQVAARDAGVQRFVYASSSAVYGDHPALPKVEAITGRAMSPYGLTKWVNELYADVFDVCYGFKSIGMRYFNVFGAAPGPERRLCLGDPGVDRRAAARPGALHQRRRHRGARLLPHRQRGAGEPARRDGRRSARARPGLQHRARRPDLAPRALRDDPHPGGAAAARRSPA